MIPIGDDNSDRKIFPIVNYLLIAANILVFIVFQKFGRDNDFTLAYSAVPGEILSGHDIVTGSKVFTDPSTGQDFLIPGLGITPVPVWLTLITSIFMHGGIAHLAGNMLYLLIFGDNIENRLGHLRYIFFYLVCGVIASLSHVFFTYFLGQDLLLPSLGASGAISGVLGGYIWLFPTRRVHVFLFWTIISIPAVIVIGFWILFQVVSGMGILGGESDGVAYAAHVGGFIAGLLLIKIFDPTPRKVYAR